MRTPNEIASVLSVMADTLTEQCQNVVPLASHKEELHKISVNISLIALYTGNSVQKNEIANLLINTKELVQKILTESIVPVTSPLADVLNKIKSLLEKYELSLQPISRSDAEFLAQVKEENEYMKAFQAANNPASKVGIFASTENNLLNKQKVAKTGSPLQNGKHITTPEAAKQNGSSSPPVGLGPVKRSP